MVRFLLVTLLFAYAFLDPFSGPVQFGSFTHAHELLDRRTLRREKVVVQVPRDFSGWIESCKRVLAQLPKRGETTLPRIQDFRWFEDRVPPEALWLVTMRRDPQPRPPKGHELFWYDEGFLKGRAALERHFRPLRPNVWRLVRPGLDPQWVVSNGEYERELLTRSDLETYPHEVWGVRLITDDGVYESQIFEGKVSSVRVDHDVLSTIVMQLREVAAEAGGAVSAVEFNHSHPGVEFGWDGKRHPWLRLADLNKSDIAAGKEFSNLPGIQGTPLIMRATTVMVTYEVMMIDGNIQD